MDAKSMCRRKRFELLLLLVQQRSRALSKSELQESLWPSTFVGETNLATLVAEIRRALGDSAQEATFVRTVHRFGYRFVAEVFESTGGGQSRRKNSYVSRDRRSPIPFGRAPRSSAVAVTPESKSIPAESHGTTHASP